MAAQTWDEAADAWIDHLGDHGDWGRRAVIDPALQRLLPPLLSARETPRTLDVGCGEGRLCRMLRSFGARVTGVEPAAPLLQAARDRDPDGAMCAPAPRRYLSPTRLLILSRAVWC